MSSINHCDRATRWRQAFTTSLQEPERAAPLKVSALSRRLGDWTTLLTSAVVESCRRLGWSAAAKGFPLNLLPQTGQEYLSLDAMAFEPLNGAADRWLFPVAVFELENSGADDRVAYSLWKVLCVRCPLRVVFAYREDWTQGRDLIAALAAAVITPIPPALRGDLTGQTLVILGSRGEGDTFPYSYFKFWELDANLGRFEIR
jgi:hypothetical protein